MESRGKTGPALTPGGRVFTLAGMGMLYYGNNLDILRRYVKDETVDLIYLDPPFNSNAAYNVLFAEHDGSNSSAQIEAFSDTWHWTQEAEATYCEIVEGQGAGRVA